MRRLSFGKNKFYAFILDVFPLHTSELFGAIKACRKTESCALVCKTVVGDFVGSTIAMPPETCFDEGPSLLNCWTSKPSKSF